MQKKYLKNIKGIIFDLDGTLYHMKWYMKPLMTLGIFPNITVLPKLMRVRKEFAGKDMKSNEALMNSIANKLGNNTKKMRNWIDNKFYPSFIKALCFLRGSRPELNKTLRLLKNKNIKLAVLSDFAAINERLDSLKIEKLNFDTIISSEIEGALKPSVVPFNKISSEWNILPENILVVGDRDDTDGEAARLCGMKYMKISDKKKGAGKSFSWSEIKKYLNDL